MNRNFRLKQSSEFMRVRRFGKSYAHPLVVLVVMPVTENHIHIGVTAGRSVGNAVQRNRAKRMLREATRGLIPRLKSGLEIILISRSQIQQANLHDIQVALSELFEKANLISDNDGN